MGKTKKMAIDIAEEAEVVASEEQILNQPRVEDAFAIPPALREALINYLGAKPVNDSDANKLYQAVAGALPMKVTINPA